MAAAQHLQGQAWMRHLPTALPVLARQRLERVLLVEISDPGSSVALECWCAASLLSTNRQPEGVFTPRST